MHLAAAHPQVDVVVRDDAGEPLGDPDQLDGVPAAVVHPTVVHRCRLRHASPGALVRSGPYGVLGTVIWPLMIAALYASSCGAMSARWSPVVAYPTPSTFRSKTFGNVVRSPAAEALM